MKKFISHSKLFLALFAVAVALSSCCPDYIPNAINIPNINEEGQGTFGITTGVSGFDVQTAYGVSPEVAIMANGNFRQKRVSLDSSCYHTQSFIEIAPGYFINSGNAFRFDVYGGAGFGSTENFYRNDDNNRFERIQSNFLRIMIQPNVAAATEYFEAGFTLRFAYVNFLGNRATNNTFATGQSVLYVDPVFSMKFGPEMLKFSIQAGLSIPSQEVEVFNSNPFIFNAGIHYQLK